MGATIIHVYHEQAGLICDAIREVAPDQALVALSTRDELRAALPEIVVLFAGRPPRDGWADARKLRLVQLMGAGMDTILPSPDLPADVTVAGARGEFAAEVCEHALAMMLSWCRSLPALFERQRAQIWKQFEVGTLAGETLCIVGLGAIGSRLARAAAALDMRVVGVCRTPRAIPHVTRVVAPSELLDVLRESRWLVLCAPLTPETTRMIDARALEALPEGAFLVNVARAGLVDERALADALASGRLGGAALDVLDDEPLPHGHAWWTSPNTIVTPHIAGVGRHYLRRCITLLLANVAGLEA